VLINWTRAAGCQVVSAGLSGCAGRPDRQRRRSCAGAQEEERERERVADAERAEKQEERDGTDEPAAGYEQPRFRSCPA
jgi:hypothetical protein